MPNEVYNLIKKCNYFIKLYNNKQELVNLLIVLLILNILLHLHNKRKKI
jgi:hypothetical protein